MTLSVIRQIRREAAVPLKAQGSLLKACGEAADSFNLNLDLGLDLPHYPTFLSLLWYNNVDCMPNLRRPWENGRQKGQILLQECYI